MVKQKNGGKKSVKNTAALGKTNGKVSRNSTSGRGRSRSEPQTIGAKGEEPTLTQRLRQEVYRQSLLPKPPAVQPLKIDLSKAKNRRAERTAKAENPPLGAAALKRGTPTGSENSQNLKDALTSHLSRQFLPVSDFRISSAYGVDRGTHRHSGIDLAVPVGTKVAAAKGGQVSFAGWGNGYGYRVVIDHDDGTQTTYNHLSDIGVKVGDKVRAGSTVALSGNTGNSTGPHLHFEVKADGRYVDPSLYFDFDNGTVAADEGTYTSQMDKAAATGTKSPASNRSGSSSGSSSGASSRSGKSGGSAPKKVTLPAVKYASPPKKEYFDPGRWTDSPDLSRRTAVNYFQNDKNPLLELIPVYRIQKRRTGKSR